MTKHVIQLTLVAPGAVSPWQWLLQTLERLRQNRRRQRELRLLDEAGLRDLGIDRSELSSYEAEAAGEARCTRRRVAHTPAHTSTT